MMRASLLLATLAFPAATLAADFAGPNQHICGTGTFMGANALSVGESGFWTVLQGTANFTNANSPTSQVNGLSIGENIFRWTVVGPGGSASDQVSIFCYDHTMPLANAGPDQTVSTWPGNAQLSGSAVIAPAICVWSVVSGWCTIADPYDPATMIGELYGGDVVLQWSCDNSPCAISQDQVTIGVVVGIEEAWGGTAPYYDVNGQRLVFPPMSPASSILLIDQQGRMVRQLDTPPGAGTWDLGALPAGLYSARLRTPDATSILRFVVGN